MWSGTPLLPEAASTMATRVDALYFFLLGVAGLFSLLIAGLIVYYALKFHRQTPRAIGPQLHGNLLVEIVWTVIPLLITIVIFLWGADLYYAMSRPPDESLDIYVVAKQWMWKFQHLDGQREINELHVPVGREACQGGERWRASECRTSTVPGLAQRRTGEQCRAGNSAGRRGCRERAAGGEGRRRQRRRRRVQGSEEGLKPSF